MMSTHRKEEVICSLGSFKYLGSFYFYFFFLIRTTWHHIILSVISVVVNNEWHFVCDMGACNDASILT